MLRTRWAMTCLGFAATLTLCATSLAQAPSEPASGSPSDETNVEATVPFAAQIAEPKEIDPSLPNVLIIGDSVSIGYTLPVRRELEGKANIFRVPENARGTIYGLKHIDEWLEGRKWDVIVFNWGSWDTVQESADRYCVNLRKLVKRLRETDATLLFAGTVPAPEIARGFNGGKAEYFERQKLYNASAHRVLVDEKIPCIDLLHTSLPHISQVYRPNDYHLSPAALQTLARKVAYAIEHPDTVSIDHAPSEFSYYMIVFALQSGPANVIEKSHTFATFVKANQNRQIIDTVTISWLAASGIIETLNPVPQSGANWSLRDTLEWGSEKGARMSKWGPYVIDAAFFERAKRRTEQLDRGNIKYLILDRRWRRHTGTRGFDCIHALSDIGGYLATGSARGEDASRKVAKHFKPWIRGRLLNEHWLFLALGIDRFPFIDRDL
ncbi:hypothetical protein Pan216_29770 [Planctomycetes bacterium Pan216]|uniref:SGNH hydrolase-type esterase domain-containing protein n=1 Tax=Kolteria novifilia TaxID=2527975 RepID=A0A518B555_9BACT|nr:hypothetical protein Pan216_29770 [Planctomycetes bacterium Pan216]